MKKTLIIAMLALYTAIGYSQITLENIYSYSGAYAKLPVSGNKFYIMDVATSQCRIYNVNHTIWKTLNLSVPANNYLYDLRYLSEGLFTTDNSLCLAYVYYLYDATNAYYTFNAKIVKENGTELVAIPGCQYMEVVDLDNNGFKLVAYCYDYSVSPYTVQTRVYSLPGQILSSVSKTLPGMSALPYPNPAPEFVTISYNATEFSGSGTLSIVDMQGNIVNQLLINSSNNRITIPTTTYSPGLYTYLVVAGSKTIDSGRFLVN